MTNKKKKRGSAPKTTPSAPQRTSPAFVTPMAARVVKKLPEGDDWVYELNSTAPGRWSSRTNSES